MDETKKGAVREAFEAVEKAEVRRLIVERNLRVDGRKANEIRPISIDMAYLPRAHGSSVFTRGETQALVSATLGTKSDEQKIESHRGRFLSQLHAALQLPLVLGRRGPALRLALPA